jgi:hypothetical protein
VLKSRRRRCAKCRFDWRPGQLPLRLSRSQWRDLLQWFVRGATSAAIAHETGLNRKRVLRALTAVRRVLATEAPEHPPRFHHPSSEHERHSPRRGRSRTLGLTMTNGSAWAEVLSEGDAETFERYVTGPRAGTPAVPPGLLPYTAVVYRRRLYRLAAGPESSGAAAFGPLEAFWAYLQRHLRSRGGVRAERLHLYLAEYSWRYNRRSWPPQAQLDELVRLLEDFRERGGTNRLAVEVPRSGNPLMGPSGKPPS